MKFDIVVIGAGPAGLTAAIYGLRSGCSVAIVEKYMVGGQVALSSEVENYPGMRKLIGTEWGELTRVQVEELGGHFVYDEVTSVDVKTNTLTLMGGKLEYKALILAMGAKPRLLNVPGEQEFAGRGVGYCAICDGGFFKGKDVAVVGGGDSAFEDAEYLANLCSNVHILVRGDKVRAQQLLIDEVNAHKNIKIHFNTQIKQINGSNSVENVLIEEKGVSTNLAVQGVFVAIGRVPDTDIVKGVVNLDENGYILTDEHMHTNLPNVWASGDVRRKSVRQIVTASADGAIAGTNASKYVKNN